VRGQIRRAIRATRRRPPSVAMTAMAAVESGGWEAVGVWVVEVEGEVEVGCRDEAGFVGVASELLVVVSGGGAGYWNREE